VVQGGSIDPIAEYDHSQGNNCIIGGYVYRGKAISSLEGWYLYADFSTGRIWGLRWEKGKTLTSNVQLLKQDVNPSSFGEDAEGEVYVCDHGHGMVWKLVGK
jgi:sugar lactone lactonase YvrE